MSELRVKSRSFNIHLLNIKISPKEENEDFTNLYANVVKKIHSENIAVNTRGDKYMEVRTQYSYKDDAGDEVLYGRLTYYTILDTTDWYNKRTKTIENKEQEEDLFPNAKEAEYFFIPKAHRFCFITKSNGIALSQVEEFLKQSLQRVVDDKEVFVTVEVQEDVIERILNAHSLSRLTVELSYSNNDLSEDFEAFLDNDLREGQVEKVNFSAQSFKKQSIDLRKSKVLNSAVRLSRSNGSATAVVQNEQGKSEIIATVEYPRKELISSTEGNEHKDILSKIMGWFRNG